MHGFNNVYQQTPYNIHEAQLERDAIARQQAHFEAYARAAQAQAATAATPGNTYRMPQMFHGMGDDSDEEDYLTRLQRRDQRAHRAPAGLDDMDVDGSQARAYTQQPDVQFPSAQPHTASYPYPQPQFTSYPTPQPPHVFPTPQTHDWHAKQQHEQQQFQEQQYQQQQQQYQQQQLSNLHAAATRIQRVWRRYLFLRNWRRNTSLRQLSTLHTKFDALVSSFAAPDVLEYGSSADGATQLPTRGVPYASFVRLSTEAQASMERALGGGTVPSLAFTPATRAVLALNEELTRLLSTLDAVPSWGDSSVRDARKQLASIIEGEAARLDAWWRMVWYTGRSSQPWQSVAAADIGGSSAQASPPSMPEPAHQHVRQPRRSQQHQQQQREQQDPASPMGQLAGLRAQFEQHLADFAAPEVLEYTLQPARVMHNGLELIGRLRTAFLPHASFVRPAAPPAKGYAGPPLAFTPATRPIHGLNDVLTRLLSDLDAIESGGDMGVRDARKGLAGDVEGEAARLETWWQTVWARKGGEADVVKLRT